VIALDVSGERLARAKEFGAAETVNPRSNDPVGAIKESDAWLRRRVHARHLVADSINQRRSRSHGASPPARSGFRHKCKLGTPLRLSLHDTAEPPYIAGPHSWGDKFVPRHLSNGFGQLPFVYGDPLANQFDGSFLIGFVCKEIPHDSRFSRVVTRMFHPAGILGTMLPYYRRSMACLNQTDPPKVWSPLHIHHGVSFSPYREGVAGARPRLPPCQ
jgi:hypothetical protein